MNKGMKITLITLITLIIILLGVSFFLIYKNKPNELIGMFGDKITTVDLNFNNYTGKIYINNSGKLIFENKKVKKAIAGIKGKAKYFTLFYMSQETGYYGIAVLTKNGEVFINKEFNDENFSEGSFKGGFIKLDSEEKIYGIKAVIPLSARIFGEAGPIESIHVYNKDGVIKEVSFEKNTNYIIASATVIPLELFPSYDIYAINTENSMEDSYIFVYENDTFKFEGTEGNDFVLDESGEKVLFGGINSIFYAKIGESGSYKYYIIPKARLGEETDILYIDTDNSMIAKRLYNDKSVRLVSYDYENPDKNKVTITYTNGSKDVFISDKIYELPMSSAVVDYLNDIMKIRKIYGEEK